MLLIRKLFTMGVISACCVGYSLANDVLSPYVNNNTPAFATLIIKNNKTVFKGVQGCAVMGDSKCTLKANADTPFAVASVSKHFTAAAILLLEEEGKLSTDDDITKYIPGLPVQFSGIKIRHLLFQISGVPNYTAAPGAMDFDQILSRGKKSTESDAFTYIISAPLKPYSKEYVYSNSGYVLLTKIIENVSGKSYAQFMQQQFFDRFKMRDAFVMSAIGQHGGYAQSYSQWPLYKPTNWMKAIVLSGEGGLFLSINDLEKWAYAFSEHKIFAKEQTMTKFLSIGKYDDGKEVLIGDGDTTYGFGLNHSEESKNGSKYSFTFHNGGMPGSAAGFSNIQKESESIWVIYLNNAGGYPPEFDILDQAKIKY